jgi:PDZ domain
MRATGRFFGFCLAAALVPAAYGAAPVYSEPATHTPRLFNSDSPPSVGLDRTLSARGGRAAEPGLELRACDQPPTYGRNSDARNAADVQAPVTRSQDSGDTDPQVDGARMPSDGVHRGLGVRSAVLDTDKVGLGMNPAPVADDQSVSLKVRPLNDRERSVFAVPEGGLVVTAVGQGAAQQAGFRQGDVVLMLDGISLTSSSQFYQLIRQRPHNRPVPVLVRRPTSDLFLPLGSTRR